MGPQLERSGLVRESYEKEQKEWTFSSKPKLSSEGKDVRMGKDTARLCNWDQAKKTTNLHSFFSVLF